MLTGTHVKMDGQASFDAFPNESSNLEFKLLKLAFTLKTQIQNLYKYYNLYSDTVQMIYKIHYLNFP